ncbi:hypothetical protein [Streptomyces sp. SID1034]|uniref:hypothetical protein n=1 Tax=Streptomyces sp. SID1034 TaxID=2690248 RepID=UPI00144FED5D|nr:hypothetical protein [Streptomyces sp. SID1034]MYV93467.1 hypothetical protein [Streptomyces sp. SID1034]
MEEYQAHQLERTRAVIRELEAEQERLREREKKQRMQVSWQLQPSRADGGVALLHRANCGLYTKEMGYLNAQERRSRWPRRGSSRARCAARRTDLGMDERPEAIGQGAGVEGITA